MAAADTATTASKYFPAWGYGALPDPPAFHMSRWTTLIGPGLVMVGANIGGGEWLFGPLVTAQYGGRVLWIATVAILMQVAYNLSVMRYALWCGEPIVVGFFRTPPGPLFWTVFYMVTDLGSLLPFLSASAAVPLASVILGRLPTSADDALVRTLGYCIFYAAFVPLIFGGKVYNAIEKVMVTKLVVVLGYLGFTALFLVKWDTWREIFTGFFRFGALPTGEFSWATLAAFAAVAGAGGMTNSAFSNYTRDKGWGMGARVGALPSAVGGRTIRLSHSGQVFEPSAENLNRWSGWLRHIRRDQLLLWGPGCMLGMALPALFSYQYIRGASKIEGHAAAAMSAQAIADQHGQIFWFLTLLCGFLVMAPTQVSQIDNIARRWTDVVWTGVKRLHSLDGNQVKYIYYGILAAYALWGTLALSLTPNPLVLAILTGVLWNFVLGFSALHTLYVVMTLLPAPLRPGWLLRSGLAGCAVFYLGITGVTVAQQWPKILAWLGA